MTSQNQYKAAILGMAGLEISVEEEAFFRKHQPVGYILFQRNCESPEQVKQLTDKLREIAGTDRLMILIDQEGGRVARLKPPHWRKSPAAAELAACAVDREDKAKQLVYLNSRLIASELRDLGITVDCAPLADIPVADCHDIIGDRAYGEEPQQVISLAREVSNGLLDGGVLPVLKHIPGHGRALVDSHEDLPVVDASLDELRKTDFVPFAALNDIPLGMTAHIIYEAIDASATATLSPKVIGEVVRGELGYDGLLMSDDISMKALKGDMGELTQQIIAAGCDLVLHCNGKMSEMQPIMEACPQVDDEANRRLNNAWAMLDSHADKSSLDGPIILSQFNELYDNKSAVA